MRRRTCRQRVHARIAHTHARGSPVLSSHNGSFYSVQTRRDHLCRSDNSKGVYTFRGGEIWEGNPTETGMARLLSTEGYEDSSGLASRAAPSDPASTCPPWWREATSELFLYLHLRNDFYLKMVLCQMTYFGVEDSEPFQLKTLHEGWTESEMSLLSPWLPSS